MPLAEVITSEGSRNLAAVVAIGTAMQRGRRTHWGGVVLIEVDFRRPGIAPRPQERDRGNAIALVAPHPDQVFPVGSRVCRRQPDPTGDKYAWFGRGILVAPQRQHAVADDHV